MWLHAKPIRPRPLAVASLDHRVEIVTAALGDAGRLLHAAADGADGWSSSRSAPVTSPPG